MEQRMEFSGQALKWTDAGRRAAAEVIGCEVAVLQAVIEVEAGGTGFDRSGRPTALFEPHVFFRVLSGEKRRRAVAAKLAYSRWGTRPYPLNSYPRILAACAIDEERALQATSWGLPQILGINHQAAGFSSAADMVIAFCKGEDEQLRAMAQFIVTMKLDGPLRRRDWTKFAKSYNGPSYKRNGYDVKLARTYSQIRSAQSITVPSGPSSKNNDQVNSLSAKSQRSTASPRQQ
jgi:hypothetical protein